VVTGSGKRLAVECDGERFHGPEKVQEDMDRQAVLERLGWQFVRIRGSVFFRDEDRAMLPVFERLEELGIGPELQTNETNVVDDDAATDRIIRRAEELRREWSNQASESSDPRDEILLVRQHRRRFGRLTR